MPEGDTIHRLAERLRVALSGREVARAAAPNPRSPLSTRASEIEGRVLEAVEARGKHLLAHFSGAVALHSHLGMSGRWFVTADGRPPYGRPWLTMASGPVVASQQGGMLLRLVSESRLRNDPGLMQLGPDPLEPGFDPELAASRLLAGDGSIELGDVLLDQRVIAGIGNVIRNEACFRARVSPWRRLADLERVEAVRVVEEAERVMSRGLATGRRPHAIYKPAGRRCPRCGGRVSTRGQGDANRITYWCPACQA